MASSVDSQIPSPFFCGTVKFKIFLFRLSRTPALRTLLDKIAALFTNEYPPLHRWSLLRLYKEVRIRKKIEVSRNGAGNEENWVKFFAIVALISYKGHNLENGDALWILITAMSSEKNLNEIRSIPYEKRE